MTLKEFMTLAEIFATTIFSVKLMHDCIILWTIKFSFFGIFFYKKVGRGVIQYSISEWLYSGLSYHQNRNSKCVEMMSSKQFILTVQIWLSFSGLQKRTQGNCERVYGIDFLMLQMVCKVKEMNVLLCVRVE